jgi:hypothetical protein
MGISYFRRLSATLRRKSREDSLCSFTTPNNDTCVQVYQKFAYGSIKTIRNLNKLTGRSSGGVELDGVVVWTSGRLFERCGITKP